MSAEILQYKDYQIQIKRRSYQRRMILSVKADGRIVMTAPKSITLKWVFKMLSENEAWLGNSVQKYQTPKLKLETGSSVFFLGKSYCLQILSGEKSKAQIDGDYLKIITPHDDQDYLREILAQFYKKQGIAVLKERIQILSQRLNLYPSSLSFRAQKTRWGSCSALGHISLNWKLVVSPIECIDYVIIHELCHLEHKNHSAKFWNLVEKHQPLYLEQEKWLKLHLKEFDFLLASEKA